MWIHLETPVSHCIVVVLKYRLQCRWSGRGLYNYETVIWLGILITREHLWFSVNVFIYFFILELLYSIGNKTICTRRIAKLEVAKRVFAALLVKVNYKSNHTPFQIVAVLWLHFTYFIFVSMDRNKLYQSPLDWTYPREIYTWEVFMLQIMSGSSFPYVSGKNTNKVCQLKWCCMQLQRWFRVSFSSHKFTQSEQIWKQKQWWFAWGKSMKWKYLELETIP